MSSFITHLTMCDSRYSTPPATLKNIDHTRSVKVNSNPQGAGIYIAGLKRGVTPAVIELPIYIYVGEQIELRKPGYENQILVVNAQFQDVLK